jgi:hypothetical protein
MRTFGLAFVLLLSAAQAASAQAPAPAPQGPVCVILDEQRDTLSPEDRRAAAISFGQAMAKYGQQVVAEGCAMTITFYNVKLGQTISVYVVGPTGPRQARASKIDELPQVYEQIAHSLISGEPMGSMDNVDRTNATADQMAPRRVAADGLKYVRIGYGAVTGRSTVLGTAFGFGYRHELDQIAVDISFLNMVYASDRVMDSSGIYTTKGGLNGELVGVGALDYAQPLANNSMYYGGRLGYGLNDYTDGTVYYSANGLQLTGVVGYEMLRASTIRIFFELDVTAPLYTSDGTDATNTTTKRWAPVAALTIGAGLGHSNTVNVVNR